MVNRVPLIIRHVNIKICSFNACHWASSQSRTVHFLSAPSFKTFLIPDGHWRASKSLKPSATNLYWLAINMKCFWFWSAWNFLICYLNNLWCDRWPNLYAVSFSSNQHRSLVKARNAALKQNNRIIYMACAQSDADNDLGFVTELCY